MSGSGRTRDGADPPLDDAVAGIEAALQAALGADGRARPRLAREALRAAAPEVDQPLDAWLEAVAGELRKGAPVVVPEELVEAIAERMTAEPPLTLGAHSRLDSSTIRSLLQP